MFTEGGQLPAKEAILTKQLRNTCEIVIILFRNMQRKEIT